MKQMLIAKRDALLANRKNKNKGFTLVELVVVIVILAILIGVTIGGVYNYVGQSRENTDMNNAAAIQSSLSLIGTDQKVYNAAKEQNSGTILFQQTWTDKTPSTGIVGSDAGKNDDVIAAIKTILTDGLPKSQTGREYELTIKTTGENKSGEILVTCVVKPAS